ncbi:MAG: ABC transporter permease [Bacteroidota bacterium]|jgi:ribose/xylose/arabinose/galactoside ABC-type transport system permease subunit
MRDESDAMKHLLSKLASLVGLVFVFVLFTVLQPAKFPTAENMEIMLLQTAVVGTAALGMTLVIMSGGIDLSVGSVIALSTVVIALLLNVGAAPAFAAMGGIGVGALCGLLIGFIVTRAKLPSFIVTLGMWGALRGAAKGLAGEQMIAAPNTWLNKLLNTLTDNQRWMLVPPGVWMMAVLALIVGGMLHFTRRGRYIVAVGSNEEAARLSGVSVDRTKLSVYILGSTFAAIAGVLQFSYLTVGDPTTATGMELDVIAAVVIGGGSLAGGRGSVFGSLVGALIMTIVGNGCTKMELPNWVQEIVTGLIIVVAVMLDRLRHRRSG